MSLYCLPGRYEDTSSAVFALVSVHCLSLTDRSVPDIFYPFGADVGDSILPDSDGASSPALDISTGFPFLFGNFSSVYVSSKVLKD